MADTDRVLLTAVLVLIGSGLLCLAGSARLEPQYFEYCARQSLWALAGLVLLLLVSRLDYGFWSRAAWPLYGTALGLLIITLFFGATIRGSKSWFDFGLFSVQTSELAKIALALGLAKIAGQRGEAEWSGDYDRAIIRRLLAIAALGLPPLLLIMLQGDLGTALTLLPMLLLALLFSGIPLALIGFGAGTAVLTVVLTIYLLLARWTPATHSYGVLFARLVTEPELLCYLLLAICFVLLAVAYLLAAIFPTAEGVQPVRPGRWRRWWRGTYLLIVVFVLALAAGSFVIERLKPYQQQRLISFINPEAQARQGGYNVLQAKIAIGSGGLWGRGFGNGTQHRLGFLPEAHTDFIYAIWAEEWGLLGVMLLLAAYAFIAQRAWRIAVESRDRFSAAFTLIFSGGVLLQAAFNLGMNLGLLPIMGVPLPLVSYGGSSLVSTLLGFGIMQAIWRSRLAFRGAAL